MKTLIVFLAIQDILNPESPVFMESIVTYDDPDVAWNDFIHNTGADFTVLDTHRIKIEETASVNFASSNVIVIDNHTIVEWDKSDNTLKQYNASEIFETIGEAINRHPDKITNHVMFTRYDGESILSDPEPEPSDYSDTREYYSFHKAWYEKWLTQINDFNKIPQGSINTNN